MPALIFLLAFVIALGFHFLPDRELINDESLELLQAANMPLDGFYLLAPSFTDAWEVDGIESLMPYCNLALFRIFGISENPVRFFHALIFAMTALALFLLVNHFHNWRSALITAGCYAVSGYGVCFNQILTRNAATPLFLVTALYWLCKAEHDEITVKKRRITALTVIPLTLLAGTFTYSSFRAAVASFYTVWFIERLYRSFGHNERSRIIYELLLPVGSSAVFLFIFILSLTVSSLDINQFFWRAHYIDLNFKDFFEFMGCSLIWPILYLYRNDFFVEATHLMYGKAPLPVFAAPFWLLGLAATFTKRCPAVVSRSAFIGLIGSAFFALTGPNLKYFYVFWPSAVILFGYGTYRVVRRLPGKFATALPVLIILALAAHDWSYLSERLSKLYDTHWYFTVDAKAAYAAEAANRQEKTGLMPIIFTPFGREAAFWKRRIQSEDPVVCYKLDCVIDILRRSDPDELKKISVIGTNFRYKRQSEEFYDLKDTFDVRVYGADDSGHIFELP